MHDPTMGAADRVIERLRAENERLREGLRIAYQYAWNIEEKSAEVFIVLRAKEIKRVAMDALQAPHTTTTSD